MKKLTALLLVLFVAFVAVACGSVEKEVVLDDEPTIETETNAVIETHREEIVSEEKIPEKETEAVVEEDAEVEVVEEEAIEPVAEPEPETIAESGTVVVFDTSFGSFEITLFDAAAPIAAGNFRDKVASGFYNGLTFHRIVEGFVAQGGDPLGTGTGGGQMNVDANISGLSNLRGTLAMASSSRAKPITDQSDAQFFINLVNNTFLDGMGFYAFGEVTSGMSVVDKLALVEKKMGADGAMSSPITPVVIDRAYVK
ncbi:MAG TPA: peptidylprolyl isomerase [Caldisericia bacterium]|nr:peptidylprolyl isomerase [Caldisericia bacterium]HPF48179.1 peptidylprolyl isomerase [Caldisericia bacterium]HPI83885.1 peptidylprolyl isomerase [Caldisericia bacterium]HPQ92632.1 peptidylprolyl isomerase [Caldisericia bacterium]HRV74270.1 peptidylprolyl isomerase [Caldisericia bacterium]